MEIQVIVTQEELQEMGVEPQQLKASMIDALNDASPELSGFTLSIVETRKADLSDLQDASPASARAILANAMDERVAPQEDRADAQ